VSINSVPVVVVCGFLLLLSLSETGSVEYVSLMKNVRCKVLLS